MRAIATAAFLALSLMVVGCGDEDDFDWSNSPLEPYECESLRQMLEADPGGGNAASYEDQLDERC